MTPVLNADIIMNQLTELETEKRRLEKFRKNMMMYAIESTHIINGFMNFIQTYRMSMK